MLNMNLLVKQSLTKQVKEVLYSTATFIIGCMSERQHLAGCEAKLQIMTHWTFLTEYGYSDNSPYVSVCNIYVKT